MPLYEYQCRNCGSEFEKMVRFSEVNVLPECPDCRSHETRKKISVFATAGAGTQATSSGLSSGGCGSGSRFT